MVNRHIARLKDGIGKRVRKIVIIIFRKKKEVRLGLYGPVNGGKCVTPDTQIVFFDGQIRNIKSVFDEIKKGALLKTDNFKEMYIDCRDRNILIPSFDINQLKILPKRVSFVYAQRYVGTIYNIRTRSGKSIGVTPDHPLIRISDNGIEKVRAAKLSLGDSVAVARRLALESSISLGQPSQGIFITNEGLLQSRCTWHNPKEIKIPSYIDENFVNFIAYVLSESYYTKNRIIFSNLDVKILAHFKYLCHKLFALKPIERINKGVPTLDLCSKTLTDYLEDVLALSPCTSETKKIPSQLMGLPDNLIAAFLRTFCDCEAYVPHLKAKRDIEIASKSKLLLEQIQILLNRFGIVGSLKPKLVNGERYYRLFIGGSENHSIFRDKIGFNVSYKSERLNNLCKTEYKKRNIFGLPIMSSLEKLRRELNISQEKFFLQRKGKGVSKLMKTNRITQHRLERMSNSLKDIEFINKLANSDNLWDNIVEIGKEKYDGYVYDLTVEDTHTFLTSSGLIASNTTLANRICLDWLGEEMGKVSVIPHETREIQMKEKVEIEGDGKKLTFNLIDTPGIATKIDFEDFLKYGMKRDSAKKRAKEATKGVIEAIKWLDNVDMVLIVLDSSQDPLSQVNITILGNLAARKIPFLIVANKVDIKKSKASRVREAFPNYKTIGISAKTGFNVDELYKSLLKEL